MHHQSERRMARRPWLGHRGVLAVLLAMGLSRVAEAQTSCDSPVAKFVSITGAVEVQHDSGNGWVAANLDTSLCQGDSVRVGERARAALALVNDAVLRLDQATTIRLLDITGDRGKRSWLDLVSGALQSFSRKPRFLTVNTPYLNGSIEGTEFVARVQGKATEITVFEGVVRAANKQGEVAVSRGESARAAAGEAPYRRTVIRPRDQVQWALYYPPIVSSSSAVSRDPVLGDAARCALDGDSACGFARLEKVAPASRDASFYVLRSSLWLSVGQLAEAQADIDKALALDPGAGEAHALRAVIAVALNDNAAALAEGRRGVELSPDSASAAIALSYALQANLQLAQARDLLQEAVKRSPDNALAWARLAEVWLMLGDRRQSRMAAERAVALDPKSSRAQYVLGFAALTEIRLDEARGSFQRAIVLDSADPLPRFGRGLTEIREGRLVEGTGDIEAAVALDSNNSLLRSYLGKAYFEEKRPPLDAQQLEIAKELDPKDPTPYLYDAIRLQTENQPVKALQNIDRSIELNDNRAVYRSRLLLDQDRAARGTSQARIYTDLGFTQLGYNAAADSLAIDPASASAHRFLSDLSAATPRAELSRVSNLLQSQLLQDVNINPVQPRFALTNISLVARGGPASAGFAEFTPMFERNQLQPNVALLGGDNGTAAIEGILSGIYNRLSFSAGGLSYNTDGFRTNADLSNAVADFYAQAAITPEVNVQGEYIQRHSEWGDLAMKFDPHDFDPTLRRSLDADIWRLGLRLSPGPRSNILLSAITADRKIAGTELDNLFSIPDFGSFDLRTDSASQDRTSQYDAQYIFHADRYNLIAGGAYADVDRTDRLEYTLQTPFGDEPPFSFADTFSIKDKNAYLYANISAIPRMVWTLGVSYEQYSEGDLFDFNEASPKIGVQWQATDALLLRGAYFQGVKPVLSSNRTLQPTEIAGFNQYFDDANATKFERYGIGADWRVTPTIYAGAELTHRNLQSPVVDANTGGGIFEDREESLNRAYAYWTPSDLWAVTADVVYDSFDNQTDSVLALDVPKSVTTLTVPVAARYFLPNGFFAGLGLTYVEQEVDGEAVYAHATGKSSFSVVNLTLGYRLPKRAGILSLVVQNLLGQDFYYLDDSYRTFRDEPSMSPFLPEPTVLGQISLSF